MCKGGENKSEDPQTDAWKIAKSLFKFTHMMSDERQRIVFLSVRMILPSIRSLYKYTQTCVI